MTCYGGPSCPTLLLMSQVRVHARACVSSCRRVCCRMQGCTSRCVGLVAKPSRCNRQLRAPFPALAVRISLHIICARGKPAQELGVCARYRGWGVRSLRLGPKGQAPHPGLIMQGPWYRGLGP